MSQLVLKTLREAPSDAEAISHQLLVRGGFIRRLASGIYTFMPLGMKVLKKLNRIVEEEFDNAGAQQMLLPALHPVEIWEQTGRLTKMEDVLMLTDTKAGRFVLAPTHEEAVIQSVSSDLSSYKDLPAVVYQIQTKFRDEARPRFGLLRTKEFVMADAYSFDADQEAMRSTYQRIYQSYLKIFDRCQVPFSPVEADAGAIGGDVNHEFMAPSAIGEDHFASCPSCGYAANIEAARAGGRRIETPLVDHEETVMHHTPSATDIKGAVESINSKGLALTPADMLKSMITVGPQGELTMFVLPGDRELKVPSGYRLLEAEEFERYGFLVKGFVGPMGMGNLGVKVVGDFSVSAPKGWSAGANVADYHVSGAWLDRDFFVDEWDSVVVVKDGDPCPRCSEGMKLVRAVEIGHTFQLGLAYSSKLSIASFVGADGQTHPFWMGCYGIGMTRLVAVIAEYFADEKGLRWPTEVAPYKVGLMSIGATRSEEVRGLADRIYKDLVEAGVEVVYDDRDLGPGVKFADLELIGIPYLCVVGQRGIDSQKLEVRSRMDGSTTQVPIDEIVGYLDNI